MSCKISPFPNSLGGGIKFTERIERSIYFKMTEAEYDIFTTQKSCILKMGIKNMLGNYTNFAISLFINEMQIGSCNHSSSSAKIGIYDNANVEVSKHLLYNASSNTYGIFLMYAGDTLRITARSVGAQYTSCGFNFYFDIYDFS